MTSGHNRRGSISGSNELRPESNELTPESNELMPGSNGFNIRIEVQEHDPRSISDAILILRWVDAYLSGLILILRRVDAYLSASILILKWSILILNPVDSNLDPLAS
jgi:hypothetical protein